MIQKFASHSEAGVTSGGKTNKDMAAGKQVFDLIGQVVPFSQGAIVSTLPRGGLLMVQPPRCPETMSKAYVRDLHGEDRPSWTAILKNQTVRASDLWSASDFQSSPYLHGLLQPHGLRFAIAAPLSEPVLRGYPGAVLLFRGPDEGDFTDAELGKLKTIGREVDEFLHRNRQARHTELEMNTDPWHHRVATRMFIFNKDVKAIMPKKVLGIDPRVEQQMLQHAKQALEFLKRGQTYADRLLLPDSRGDLWVFHVAVYKEMPALGSGSFVFFMLQPEAFEWVAVRPGDVQAEPELARLLPTLKYMQQEFHRNPTLDDIAKRAHLSPFHFHRRFTDLLGETPKHFLLSCQIHEAKRALASRRKELSQIATDTGFAHQSHFTSRFKQATGLTPTRWRRMAAELVRLRSN